MINSLTEITRFAAFRFGWEAFGRLFVVGHIVVNEALGIIFYKIRDPHPAPSESALHSVRGFDGLLSDLKGHHRSPLALLPEALHPRPPSRR